MPALPRPQPPATARRGGDPAETAMAVLPESEQTQRLGRPISLVAG